MARFGGDFRIDKKGTIDLVTEVDIAVERRFRALIAERFPDHQILAEELGGAAARAVRRLGSAALDLCYVAAGRLDGFWESDLKPWDIAGGALIVAEAGGRVTDLAGAPFASRGGHVLATNGRLHDAMLAVIEADRARRAPKETL